MKKQTGFTLIELLAVIIILAIIALIATPIVLNVVEESKETARRSSIAGYASGVRYAVYDSGYALTGKLPEITKEWAESKVEVSGDKVECEEVRYSTTYETVLHKCHVGKSEKEYCYVGGKTYEDCENEEYNSIYNSLGNVAVSGKPVVEELLKQYNESNTVGLLKDETGYYYKGTNEEVANNFVWFGGHLWRVISIDNGNNLTIITQQPITSIQPASKAWENEEEYKNSYINTWLNEVFLGSMEERDKAKIQSNVFNIGIYNNVSEITTNQKVGLLDESQYTKAGSQNSYLDIEDQWWLGNRYSTSSVRFALNYGYLVSGGIAYTIGVRPVIKVSNLTYNEGEGTLDNPYREKSTTTNMAQIKVGEYISIPTSGDDCGSDKRCLFRVVSKENNAIKVTLNGLLSSTSEFGSSVTYTSGNTIDTKVKAFAETIDSKYRYSGSDTTFGIGVYGEGVNYKDVQNVKYNGTVGLPVIGEMFTANDIDASTSENKIFAKINTLENPTVSDYFWTINAADSGVRYVSHDGSLGNYYLPNDYGVRPVLFLNNNINFALGEGTAENPFMLGE